MSRNSEEAVLDAFRASFPMLNVRAWTVTGPSRSATGAVAAQAGAGRDETPLIVPVYDST